MTPAQMPQDALDVLDDSDPEKAHSTAADALMKYLRDSGQGEIADAYERAGERVGFWMA
jgi:hypothetical protein